MKLIGFLFVVAAALLIAPALVQAQTFCFTAADNNDWNDPDNWEDACVGGDPLNDVPSNTDVVQICDDVVAVISNTSAVAYSINVSDSSTGALEITPSQSSAATLTLGSGESGPIQHVILGPVILNESVSGNDATIVLAAVSHIFKGFGIGEVVGKSSAAEISIATTGMALTSDGTLIRGALQITGDADFYNYGVVQADANGTLAIRVDGFLKDSAAGVSVAERWKATAPPSGTSILLFDGTFDFGPNPVTSLASHFVINSASAKITIDATPGPSGDFTTTGRLKLSAGVLEALEDAVFGSGSNFLDMSGGTITVAAGKTFTHS